MFTLTRWPRMKRAAAAAAAASSSSSSSRVYTPITRFGWEQDTSFVNVLCFELPGVGAAKERARCDFAKDSFDLTVIDVAPPEGSPAGARPTSYRLRVLNLEKDIDPARSSYKVKKNSIEVKLRKAGQYDHWVELVSKKLSRDKKSDEKSADPSASINDMMRQMYEDGDEATRKVIGEAMLKSREEQARGAAGGGLGGGGGGGGGGAKRKGLGANRGGPSFGGGDDDDDFGGFGGGGGGGGSAGGGFGSGGDFDDL
jgi:hypothetical protein